MIDIEAAMGHLGAEPHAVPTIRGAPAAELRRSPAAAAVARSAAADELFLFHYEHRAWLPLPDVWIAPGRELEAAPPEWVSGVLEEPKYASFRHDLLIGSFNPGHRAKWTTHELCHALVGFGWAPGGSPLFHATAARLAELVPVVLWYFLDEIGSKRCERHVGPLFRTFCRDCEREASRGPSTLDPGRARGLLRQAGAFLDAELAAVARTRRLGRPCPAVWGSLDLCSDGVAYVAAHGPRLRSPEMHAWVERFATGVGATTIDDLQARVVAVVRAITEGAPLTPWIGGGATAHWVASDLGARLLQVGVDVSSETRRALSGLVDDLASGAAPAAVLDTYRALGDDVPPASEVFAVGYSIPGVPGRSVDQVRDGLRTVTPLTLDWLDDRGVDPVEAFVTTDAAVRVGLGQRFASGLPESPAQHLARYEAALRVARSDPEPHALGAGDGLRLIPGAQVLTFPFDPVAWAERVDAGEPGEPPPQPTALVVGRDEAGDLLLVDIPIECADELVSAPEALPSDVREDLVELGLLVAARWAL